MINAFWKTPGVKTGWKPFISIDCLAYYVGKHCVESAYLVNIFLSNLESRVDLKKL